MSSTVTRLEPSPDKGGQWVLLGDTEYKVPPLNFSAVKRFLPQLSQLGSASLTTLDPTKMELVAELAHCALKRNYPQLTLEEVEELLDLSNMMPLFTAMMSVSGLIQQPADAAPGEVTTPNP